MTDREFVSTTGTQHRLDRLLGLLLEPGNGLTQCGLRVDLSNPVVQQPVRKCKRCYPTNAEGFTEQERAESLERAERAYGTLPSREAVERSKAAIRGRRCYPKGGTE